MYESQALALLKPVLLLIDISSYGLKEWVAIVASMIGIIVSVVGAWRTWRYSKSQIATRLTEYLEDREAKIREARNRIIERLRRQEPLDGKFSDDFSDGVRGALRELANDDPQNAEQELAGFSRALHENIKLGQTYLSTQHVQVATVLLVKGRIANLRAEPTSARLAWETALQNYPHDAEAHRYLGELALAEADVKAARRHFTQAYDRAPDDKTLRAETWALLASYYGRQGRPRLELGALDQAAPNFSDVSAHINAAQSYERAATLANQLGANLRAPRLLRQAFASYDLAGDHAGKKRVIESLKTLGQDVTGFAIEDQEPPRRLPWRWIRLAIEIALVSVAAGMFYLSLQ
jgi:tetratricopeptide (TPR) repeat protein